MSNPLHITDKDLASHIQEVGKILISSVEGHPDARLASELVEGAVVADLTGSSCERIARNRGPRTNVLPFVPLANDLWAWVGYREVWKILQGKAKGKSNEFRSASLSIYFGLQHDAYKPQVFRLEWAGWALWDGSNYTFQGGNAAHPHWQFDLVESLGPDGSEDREIALDRLRNEEEEITRDFTFRPPSARDLVAAQKLSRIHFPSAATWGHSLGEKKHAFSPSKVQEIRGWLEFSLLYLRGELNAFRNR